MREALDRAWRVVGTGLSFAAFGIGGVLLWLVVFPLLRLFVRDRGRLQRLARGMIRRTMPTAS